MNARVIISEEEWDVYKKSFSVAKNRHSPGIPPSFPVMVFTHVHPAEQSPPYVLEAEHAFIELADLRRMLSA